MKINGILISSTTDEYGPIYVYETRTARILSFDGQIYQSYMKLKKINGLELNYTQAMMAALLFVPKIKTVTIMGLGAGSMAKNLLNGDPKLKVHAIEYRKAVVDAAKAFFFLPNSDRLFMHIEDAADYIKNADAKSDVIFSDLFNANGMEQKQVQASYLSDCKKNLNKNGVLVLNIWHTTLKSQEDLDELLALEFGNKLLSFKVESGNTIVLAFKNDIPTITRKELLNKSQLVQEKMNIPMQPYAKLILDTLDL